MIVPAPRNPMPVTICAATRAAESGWSGNAIAGATVNSADPRATVPNVRTPAGLSSTSRSRPMTAPAIPARTSRRSASSWASTEIIEAHRTRLNLTEIDRIVGYDARSHGPRRRPRAAHPRPRFDQEVRRLHGRRRDRLRRGQRRELRLPGPERRWQDEHDAHGRVRVARDLRGAADSGSGPGGRRAADPRPAGRRAAAGHARHRALGPGQPRHLCALLRAGPVRGAPEGRWAARVRPAAGTRDGQGGAALGRHEAPAHDRPVAHQRPVDPAARRADDGPGPPGAPPALGPAV